MRSWLPIVLLALVAAGCRGEQLTEGAPVVELPPLKAYSYGRGEDGLQGMMTDLVDAVIAGDRAKAEMLTRSLELENHEAWFAEHFNADLGGELAKEYASSIGRVWQLADLVSALAESGQTEILVEEFDSEDNSDAVEYQSLALSRMVRKVPLYSVRLSDQKGTKTFHLWSFVYMQGRFFWIGKTKALAGEPTQGDVDVREYRLRDRKKAREILQR